LQTHRYSDAEPRPSGALGGSGSALLVRARSMTKQDDQPPIPARPLLRAERVWLRPVEERDLPAWAAAIDDTEVGGLAGHGMPTSVAELRDRLQRSAEAARRGQEYAFTVCELGDDQFIGEIRLKDVNLVFGSAELGIVMDHDHIGAGWGTDAQRALLRFAFVNLGLQRVYLTVYVSNERAIRSYEKLGFQREGVMRSSWRGPRGLEDTLLMAILRDEWHEANPGPHAANFS
jgi:RimJ/RimL family protein N-acetyltransferase